MSENYYVCHYCQNKLSLLTSAVNCTNHPGWIIKYVFVYVTIRTTGADYLLNSIMMLNNDSRFVISLDVHRKTTTFYDNFKVLISFNEIKDITPNNADYWRNRFLGLKAFL